MSMVQLMEKPLQNLQKHDSSDAKLWVFRNKIFMMEAKQNHTTIVKHIISSDARWWAFRNKISQGGS